MFVTMPPCKCGEEQFTTEENEVAYNISKLRVHVERCIRRMKVFEVSKHFESMGKGGKISELSFEICPICEKNVVSVSFFEYINRGHLKFSSFLYF